jgi:hypothetical protein
MHSRVVFVAVAAALSVAVWSGPAAADLNDPTDNGIKGAIGLGLLGADLTLIIEGACRVRNPWLLSIIPIAVAGGGAAGGYYAGRESAAGAVAMLVSGLALIIPAAILVAYGRSYRARSDEGFVDRTEEGMPMSTDDDDEPYPEGDAETEVIGPEEGAEPAEDAEPEPPAEPPAPATEPAEGGEAPAPVEGEGATASTFFLTATMHLSGRVPVGGVLQLVAEQRSAAGAPMLSLRYF